MAVLEERAYEHSIKEYEALPPSEQDGDITSHAIVYVEAMLAGQTGKQIATWLANRCQSRYEDSQEIDWDLLAKDNE